MTKTLRKIISIDEEKCDGCGLCVPSCAEGALQIVDGKLRLVKESYCDGLGACLGECPQGALSMVDTWAEPFDEAAVMASAHATLPTMMLVRHAHESPRPAPAACPSIRLETWNGNGADAHKPVVEARSELRQWPVQLYLIPPDAPFLQGADLTIIADCVPFADPNTHAKYIKDSAIAVGCPKLDDGRTYIAKLAQILAQSDIRSLRVVRMTVPCCGGLETIARQAMSLSGVQVPLETVIVNAH
jgi:Pyruvate/2-oxoacid:ferredoxin oxidoreductase delta subunit